MSTALVRQQLSLLAGTADHSATAGGVAATKEVWLKKKQLKKQKKATKAAAKQVTPEAAYSANLSYFTATKAVGQQTSELMQKAMRAVQQGKRK